MRNKIILGFMGLAIVVAGFIAFSAFTAQVVNVTARVEKEIEVSAVTCDLAPATIPNPDFDPELDPPDPDIPETIDNPDVGKILPETCQATTGDYGVVLPQTAQDKIIELTLSKSFFKQDKYFNVTFDVLWECKQSSTDLWDNSSVGADGKYDTAGADTIPDCRDNLPHGDADLGTDAAGNAIHIGLDDTADTGDEELDGNLRDHVAVTITGAVGITDGTRCLNPPPPLGTGTRGSKTEYDTEKEIDFIGKGIVDKGAKKCFYSLKLNAPPCEQGYNEYTDPAPAETPIPCHTIDTGDPPVGNPQDLETFSDLGDDFKIQVYFHSTP